MPRHDHDDFSFLPTVDTTDEELMELAEQRKAQAQAQAPWQVEEEAAALPQAAFAPAGPAVFAPDPAFADPGPPAVFPRADQMQQVVEDLLNREVEYEEPPAQDLPADEQQGQALWQEFLHGAEPPRQGEAVEEDPDRFASGAPTVTVVLTPAEAAAIRRAAVEAEQAPGKPRTEEPQARAERPPPVPRAPEPPGQNLSRSGRRALVETPPVSFGAVAAGRDKSGRRREAPAEKDAASATGAATALGTAGLEDKAAAKGADGSGAPESKTGEEQAAKEGAAEPFVAPKPPPEEPLDADQLKKLRWKKLVEKAGLNTLGWSVAAHLVLLSIAAMWGLSQMDESPVDFLPGGGSAQSQAAEAALTNKIQQKKNPWMKAKPMMRKVTVQSLASDIVLPEMPMDALDLSSITNRMDIKAGSLGLGAPMGMGTGGAGGGFGAGIGRGGKFSFVGQTALGRRVVFVVDVSGSMSAISNGEDISRFDLLKKELAKSVNAIPMNTQYQILFFSDFAWPHDQVDSNDNEALVKYRWDIDADNYKKVKLPAFRFIQATPFTIRETLDIIQRANNPGGTNWGSGLLMALNASPKPDVIFFMTDGLQSDERGWVDIVTAENKRRLPVTTIHTSAMQQPDAARELDDLARRNNGKFSVVMGEGKIIRGEDFFKMKR